MGLRELRERFAEDEGFREAYEREYPYERVADAILRLRSDLDMTQVELARAIGTAQSVIARAESGRHAFSIELLERIAKATGAEVHVTFAPRLDLRLGLLANTNVVPLTRASAYKVTPTRDTVEDSDADAGLLALANL